MSNISFKPLWSLVHRIKEWAATPAGQRVQRAISLLLSLVIIGLLVRAVADIGWSSLVDVLPPAPAFWLFFAAQYLAQPVADWLIYRPWWRLHPIDIGVFFKKHVLNEALFAYAGDGWLMAWAARRLNIPFDAANPPRIAGRGDNPGFDPAANPFAAVKDVAITSGLAGNLFTLLMLLLALGLGAASTLEDTLAPDLLKQGSAGFAVLVALNIAILFNRNRLFTLPVRANIHSFLLHFGRVSLSHALIVGTWMVALPEVGLSAWLLLGALRLVISRMPLPNKQLLFAAIAASIAGDAAPALAALMAAQGVLTIAGHALTWFLAEAMQRRPAPAAP
ncbi:hypothetical protein [Polymorphobacter sp.]|uniref:hypothetical protein n=1 Tax=Polymorphobacter sp. TaxID=1909290 RepID=UPI003F71DE58